MVANFSTSSTSIKKGIDLEEARKKREDNVIELRKSKREEALAKRRTTEHLNHEQVSIAIARDCYHQRQLASLPQLVEKIYSDDPNLHLEATQGFRKLLSLEKSPPIDEVIRTNVIPRLVDFLTHLDNPKLQFESAWALTNVASGTSDHTRVVIESGAVPIFCQLLQSSVAEVREQAVWALGNIAGDSPACRDVVLNTGTLLPLLGIINNQCSTSLLRNCTWTLSNLCRGKPQPRFEMVSGSLATLAELLNSTDTEVITDACWAFSYLSDGSNHKIQAVIDTGISARLVELLMFPNPAIIVPALRTVGNIVTGDDLQTDEMIAPGVLPCLNNLLVNSIKKSIRKEACWTISNITAGTLQQIRSVIEAGLIAPLVHILSTAEFDIKKEAAWAISNATSGGSADEIRELVSCGCVPPLCDLLECQDNRIITVALEGLENILQAGELGKPKKEEFLGSYDINAYAVIVDECGGLEKIEELLKHRLDEIYNKALNIIEKYFGVDSDENIDQDKENFYCPTATGDCDGIRVLF